jgi:hypothetical protein
LHDRHLVIISLLLHDLNILSMVESLIAWVFIIHNHISLVYLLINKYMNLFLLCIGYGIWTKWRWTLYVVRSWNITSRVNYLQLTHILLVKHLLMKVILLMNWVSLWLVEDISSGFSGSIFIGSDYENPRSWEFISCWLLDYLNYYSSNWT